MLKVMTWLWQQPGCRTTYTPEHVRTWRAMVRRHLSLPHRLAVITDIKADYGPDVEIVTPPRDFDDIRIPTWGSDKPQCHRRLALFRPDAAMVFGADRFVSMDMDCVIADCLDPLFDRPEEFVMYKGTSSVRPYNGSMLMMRAGARPQVHACLTPERAIAAGRKYVGSDQSWISYILGRGEATWGPGDGVLWYGSRFNATAPCRRVMFFPGRSKPWQLVDEDAFVGDHYRGDDNLAEAA